VRVILVKLADRLHNMRTLDALTHEKQLKISSETIYLYAPLAHRLGLHAIKSELEDLALKYTEPEVYESISRKLRETAKSRSRFVQKFIYPIKRSLTQKGISFMIREREKSIAAIWQKMKKKEVPFEEIYDIFAIRIVIDSPPETEKTDCWKVYSAITDNYRPNLERLRDWISIPKANGYEALHITVMSHTGQWVEIQIRSHRMDEIAEKGYAAHWKYKEAMNMNSRLDNWLDRIKEMIENPEADALSFLDDVKGFFFLDEISVFTPQGELRTLPANSTVLDFAYAIHSEVGNMCIGAKVDKKLAPINHVLKNGQQVEVITSQKQKPREEWLGYVVTTRAKSSIKLAVRAEKKMHGKQGKEKLTAWFDQYSLRFSKHNIRQFLSATNLSSLIDLYYAIAQGALGPKDVEQFAADHLHTGGLNYISRDNGRQRMAPKKTAEPVLPEEGEEYENLVTDVSAAPGFSVADCCNPIPGDPVIGLISAENMPIRIHRTNCPKAQELMTVYGNKMVKVNWSQHESIAFVAEIKVAGIDRQGLSNEITRIISNDLNLNIKSFHIDAMNGLTEGVISFYVKNTADLYDVLGKLNMLEGITLVARIN
jgi:GTP pyrophosphokinase